MPDYKMTNIPPMKMKKDNNLKGLNAYLELHRGKLLKRNIFNKKIVNLRMAVGYIMKYEYN